MEYIKRNPLLIEFLRSTSDNDVEDLMALLEELTKKYHFRWIEHTYFKDELQKQKEEKA